jgi:sugar phosphate isomerase/epimerase
MNVGAAMDVRFAASVPEFMAYVTSLGLDHVELKAEYLAGHPAAPGPERLGELAEEYGVSLTLHAPFRDWNPASFQEPARQNAVERVKATLDDAAAAGAGAVVVHGGAVPERYPEWVRERAAEQARRSLRECAAHAAEVGVWLCLENQPPDDRDRRYTVTPDALGGMLDAVDDDGYLGVTLDVGHAKVAGVDPERFVDRFGDRIRVCHLHDNDGTADQHRPLREYGTLLASVPAASASFEMKSVADIARCVGAEHDPIEPRLTAGN